MNKGTVINNRNVIAASGLNGKSITSLEVYVHGAVTVVEIGFSGGSQFVKVKQGQAEVGGTNEWGTGTQIN